MTRRIALSTFLVMISVMGLDASGEQIQKPKGKKSKFRRSIEKIEVKPTVNGNWRGPAIISKERMAEIIQTHGIKTIINLAKDSMLHQKGEDCGGYKDPSRYCEPKWAAELEVNYIEGFMSDRRPSLSSWRQIKEAMRQSNAYVHCTWGADRTGAVIARYTLEEQNDADVNELYDTALRNGFKPKSHPGYGKHPDPNRQLRLWMLSGSVDKEFRPPMPEMNFKFKLNDE